MELAAKSGVRQGLSLVQSLVTPPQSGIMSTPPPPFLRRKSAGGSAPPRSPTPLVARNLFLQNMDFTRPPPTVPEVKKVKKSRWDVKPL